MKTWRNFFQLSQLLQYTEGKRNFISFRIPPEFNKAESSASNCNKCNIFKNYLISDNKFKCKVNGRAYCNRGSLSCNRPNVVFIISCKNCGDLYVGSATDFKARFRIYKSDIKTKKIVVLADILTTNVVIETILTYFSRYS